MASILGPKYLRVRTPRTSDGVTLILNDNMQPVYDETELPLTALKHLERRNKKLDKGHKLIITVIDEDTMPDQAAVSKLIKGAGTIELTKDEQKIRLREKLAELEEGDETEVPEKQAKKTTKKQAPATEELV